MNSRYIGNRPCKLLPGKWKERLANNDKNRNDDLYATMKKTSVSTSLPHVPNKIPINEFTPAPMFGGPHFGANY